MFFSRLIVLTTTAYMRLIVLVLAFEVLVTAVIGLGFYFGFSVFPYNQVSVTIFGAGAGANGSMQTTGIQATIPFYMPSLTDLKIPYTTLQAGVKGWGISAFLVSASLLVLQSFVRGMYLGGLKAWSMYRKSVPLLPYGRKNFGDMLKWSVFQTLTTVLFYFLTVSFFPFGLVFIIVILFYSLTPYLIVLQDIPFRDALAKAPRLLRHNFGAFLPFALFAMLCTLVISSFRSLPSPWGYAVPLLAYISVGTMLIGGFLRRLADTLKQDGEQVKKLELPPGKTRSRRMGNVMIVLLVPALTIASVYASSGKHLTALDFGSKTHLGGISYHTNFSDVFYASEQRYTAYAWQTGDYRLAIKLPELSRGNKPEELRGIADITWQVDEEMRTSYGSSIQSEILPIIHKSRLMYRLVRETADNGSYYYTSRFGSASILPGGEKPREPLSIQMTVSGDGSNVFILQYPTRFDISPIFRVSHDGRYMIPGTSSVNPMDFHVYWFSANQSEDSLFRLIAAKNEWNDMPTTNGAYTALACAMQEGDGRMVVKLLAMLRQAGVNAQAPDWDEATWTTHLQKRYKGATLQTTLDYLTKSGVQGSYVGKEVLGKSDDKTASYRLEVPFPDGSMLPIAYMESRENGQLLSIIIGNE